MEFVEFPKAYAAGIAIALIALTITLLIAVYFYMQASLTD
jgi:membrane protein insertase Oxa1/YidC/SpoIIIJ